ncbi:MAG TPA: tRNA(5-methylaminomethyl-2-thiouridylate) methyltransferase [Desulfomicrobiaceae bacterium]|nr:tRNA(5-methylaminomethyl-2-thiouridylate) methyltransferase [Desulfomicrobiaceae bacterium]
MKKTYHALALFSGGLDSIIATKVIQAQGLDVLGLHFVTPFFGKPQLVPGWEKNYGIPITSIDISREYIRLLKEWPLHHFGKVLNPCVDCKILMLEKARELMDVYGATFLISGEVVGQRPMSQRRDALNIIRKAAEAKEILLRPLSARLLEPTPMEESGLVDRDKLPQISGRGRKKQLELARKFKITDIPTPAGGCLLAEKESANRYWQILKHFPAPEPDDFFFANIGRQYWSGPHWLAIGRNRKDNEELERLARETDYLFDLVDFPGPSGVGRPVPGQEWSEETIRQGAALMASFSPRARQSHRGVAVRVQHRGEEQDVLVIPDRDLIGTWSIPDWDTAREEKREKEKEHQARLAEKKRLAAETYWEDFAEEGGEDGR